MLSNCHHGLPRVSRPQEQTVWPCVAVRSASEDYVLGGVFLHDGQAQKSGARVQRVAQMRHDRVSQAPRQWPDLEPSDRAIACSQDQWVPPLPSHVGSPDVGESFFFFFFLMTLTLRKNVFVWFQVGMMAEMARVPPNLDKVMNEGIAFVISQFAYRIPDTPLGQRPVMIGRRKPSYNTLDKVMKRLDLIHKVMEAMDFVVVDVH